MNRRINRFMPNRVSYFDSIRGLAALIVVIHHYVTTFYPEVTFGNGGMLARLFEMPPFGLLVAGKFAVCLFFILSGYVLSYKFLGSKMLLSSFLSAILKRPIRLGGIVLVTVAMGAALWYFELFFIHKVGVLNNNDWFANFWHGKIVIESFLRDFFFFPFGHAHLYNMPLWTIKMELYGSFLVFGFLYLFSNYRYRWFAYVVILLLLAGTFYINFFLGIIFADIYKTKPVKLSKGRARLLLCFSGLSFLYFSSYPSHVSHETIVHTIYGLLPQSSSLNYAILAASSFFIFVLLCDRLKDILKSRKLLFLGKISYSLYAIHFLVLGSFSSYVFCKLNLYVSYGLSFAIVLFVSIFVIVIIATILHRYVDIPTMRIAGKFGGVIERRCGAK